ncbi:MAG: TonB-dependent receptor [Halioglobus sp.]|nr:TonB-dependent receptor [Halioglobus sp.]
MKKLTFTALVTAAGGCILSAHASTKLEEMVVTSSRIEMPLREVATSISVVTKEDIQVRGFSTVAETLRYEPSIAVDSSGGVGKATNVRIRGEQGFRTKAYIDGIDVADPSAIGGGPNFSNLLSGAIDRVEILRGPEGLAYGADAGGVINMSTTAPQSGFTGSLEAEGGRYGTQQYLGHVAGGNETVDGVISAEHFKTDGFNAFDTNRRDDDGYENTTFHGRAGWNITDKLRADIVGRTVDGENEYDNCFAPPNFDPSDNCKTEYSQDAWRVALSYQGETFGNTLSYNSNKTDRKFKDDGILSFRPKGTVEVLGYLGSWSHSAPLTLVYGAELQKDSIDVFSFGNEPSDSNRDQQGYFVEYQGGFADSLYVSAGARYTDNDDFGSKTTYRTGITYLVEAGEGELKFKGTYGTGFRAPTLDELAFNASSQAIVPVNQALDAEQSTGYDLGVAYYATGGWYIDLVYFDQEIDDEIYFDSSSFDIPPPADGGFYGYLQGNGDTSSDGVEFITEVPVGEMVTLRGNYTYTNTKDFDGAQRAKAPEGLANLGLRVAPWEGRLIANINYRMVRDRVNRFGEDMKDFEILDVSVTYNLTDALSIQGRVENALDENYEEVSGYNTPGAAGYAGIRYRF